VSASAQSELFTVSRKLVAEALGTALLAATVIGSGIMADRLTGDDALALLGNTIPTGAILVVLIAVLSPVSGAHFNPAVTLAMALKGAIAPSLGLAYVVAQIAGGLAGTVAAQLMFGLPILDASETVRTGFPQWFAEVVATFGLVGIILGGLRFRAEAICWLVGLYITAAYWFTSSTSFANPAVAIARAFTDTFAGIRPGDLPGFIVAELIGGVLAVALFTWLFQATDAAIPLTSRSRQSRATPAGP
jgi:glycerol uptake facilitator-like aquaporin